MARSDQLPEQRWAVSGGGRDADAVLGVYRHDPLSLKECRVSTW
jgi:hypothetical protein